MLDALFFGTWTIVLILWTYIVFSYAKEKYYWKGYEKAMGKEECSLMIFKNDVGDEKAFIFLIKLIELGIRTQDEYYVVTGTRDKIERLQESMVKGVF